MNVTIGLDKDMAKAMEIVQDYFPDKKVKINNKQYGSRYSIDINIKSKKSTAKDFYNNVSKAILDMILLIYAKDIINKNLYLYWNDLKVSEKKEIGNISKAILLDRKNFLEEKK